MHLNSRLSRQTQDGYNFYYYRMYVDADRRGLFASVHVSLILMEVSSTV